jgi:lysophospholipase L1-like esterase
MNADEVSPSRASLLGLALLRALAQLLAVYFALSWLTVALYDATPFSPGYRARYLLLNLHTALAPLCLGLAALLREFRDFLLIRATAGAAEASAGERAAPSAALASATARARRLERAALAAWVFAAAAGGVAIQLVQPIDLAGGTPSLRPSSRFRMDQLSTRPTVVVDTNAAGFRDGPWPSGPRGVDGPWRVLLVGDSMVFGSGIRAQEETLTPVLARRLRGSGLPVSVNNLSLLGLNFRQEVDLLERHASTLSPNLVVVMHNEENDLMPELPYYHHLRVSILFPLGFITYVNALDRWMISHRLSAAPAAVAGLRRDTERLARLAARVGFDVLLVYLHGACRYFEPPARSERRFEYAGLGDWSERPGLTFPNDSHPTPEGVRWMAERLEPLVRRMRAPEAGADAEPLTAQFMRQCGRAPHGSRAAASGAAASSGAAGPSASAAYEPQAVLPADVEPAVRDLLGFGAGAPLAGGFAVTSIAISATSIVAAIERDAERAEIVLSQTNRAPGARWRSRSFAMDLAPGSRPSAPALRALEQLAQTVGERDRGGFWAPAERPEAR